MSANITTCLRDTASISTTPKWLRNELEQAAEEIDRLRARVSELEAIAPLLAAQPAAIGCITGSGEQCAHVERCEFQCVAEPPNCGACPGDGSVCEGECGVEGESPPTSFLKFSKESLRRKILSDPEDEPMAGYVAEPRFFIEHGMIHDRVTGKHVTTDEDYSTTPDGERLPNLHGSGITDTCALLNRFAAQPPNAQQVAQSTVGSRKRDQLVAEGFQLIGSWLAREHDGKQVIVSDLGRVEWLPVAQTGVQADETGWLLERNNAQYYCAGMEEQHNGMGFCWFPKETKSHLEALRFARREDAEKFAAQIASNVRYTAVEHAWIAASPAPTKQAEGSPHDWPEDWSHENGRYECRCVHCGKRFQGHKRRVSCKQCMCAAAPAQSKEGAP